MPVTHFVTHQIDKAQNDIGAHVQCANHESFHEDYAAQVMVQLRNIFIGRASKRYGEFGPEAPQLKALLLDWLSGRQSFLSLTERITKLFSVMLDNTKLEIDGHLAFMAEQLADGDRFYVYHIRERSGMAFNENKELTQTRFIDFSNTGFALCVDTTQLQQDHSKKYVSFSYGRGEKALQNTFVEFSGFTDRVNTEQETQVFLKIVDEYTSQLAEEEANETITKVVDYCLEQDKYGAAVNFNSLSQEINEDEPAKFATFIQQKQSEYASSADQDSNNESRETKSELIPDRKSLKNYVRYSGKNKDVTLSFSAMALGKDIEFNQQKDELILRNLPTRLLKQLKEEMK